MATNPRYSITEGLHPQQSIRSPVILLLLVLTTAQCAEAQRSPPSVTDPIESKSLNSTTAFIIIAIIIGLFCAGFFSVCFRRCRSLVVRDAATGADGNRPVFSATAKRGLDPDKLASFPTIPYTEVRELKLGIGVLECAVCLCEFEDDETLKLLPSCSHVYHPDCIDAWLASHVTCPVCRSNLAAEAAAADDKPAPADHVAIEVAEDQVEEVADLARIGSRKREMRARSMRMRRIPRSRSVGNIAAGMERFTLTLPEQVRKEIMSSAEAAIEFRRAASCAVGRSGRRISRTFSMRAAKHEQRD